MKAKISYSGNLQIIVENDTELYAVKKWAEDSVNYADNEDLININMGSFDIVENLIDPENNNGLDQSLLDHVMEMKEL